RSLPAATPELLPLPWVAEQACERGPDLRDGGRIDVLGAVARHLRKTRDSGRDDRRSGAHRLEDREAESFVQRRVAKGCARAGQGDELGVGDLPEDATALMVLAGPREDLLVRPATRAY